DPQALRTWAILATEYRDAGRANDAARCADDFLQVYRQVPAADRRTSAWFVPQAAGIFEAAGLPAKAEPILRGAVQQAYKQFGAADLRVAMALAELGSNLSRQEKWADAEAV